MAQDGPAVCECGGAVERQGQNVEAIAASAIPALAPSASETDTMAALYRLTAVAVVTDYRPRLLHCPGALAARPRGCEPFGPRPRQPWLIVTSSQQDWWTRC